MNKYKELIEQLRFLAVNSEKRNVFDEAADAIEKLIEQYEDMKEVIDVANAYGDDLKRKVNRISELRNEQFYSGTYIKAIMELEE